MLTNTDSETIVDAAGRTHQFPPSLDNAYSVVDGRVRTRSLEAHVIDHCNLTCDECCSLSPLLPRWVASPEAVARDIEQASRVIEPKVFKIVGGEPLLHPELVTIVDIARRSAIAERVSLTTNGLLLKRTPDALWEGLDAMVISLYPAPQIDEDTIGWIHQQAARFNVEINFKQQDRFVQMNRSSARQDAGRTAEIYQQCWLRERCHLIRDGVFYTCTRPPHFQSFYSDTLDFSGDGLSLDEPVEALLQYLLRPEPLAACARCEGGRAKLAPHRLLARSEIVALTRGRR